MGQQRSPDPVTVGSGWPVLLLGGLQQGEKDAVPSVLRHTTPTHTPAGLSVSPDAHF